MQDYTPSEYIQKLFEEDGLWNCTGLVTLIKLASQAGYEVAVDYLEGVDSRERVDFRTVRRAVQEVDEALLIFTRDGEHVGNMLVIASNDVDWLADYHVSLEELVEAAEIF